MRRIYLIIAALAVGGALGTISFIGEGAGGSRALTIIVNLASPWGLAAFLVGRLAPSPKWGAFAGGLTLLVGMATFLLVIPEGYYAGARDIAWTLVALIVGPVMGLCGALTAAGKKQHRHLAIVAPSAMLLAEALWVAWDRDIQRWNLTLEPHRWTDVVILGGLIALALLLPVLIRTEPRRLATKYPLIFLLGVAGSAGFAALQWLLLHL
jgi:hypothetical protein